MQIYRKFKGFELRMDFVVGSRMTLVEHPKDSPHVFFVFVFFLK